jgi:deoxyribodipyrimidine photolyase
MRLLRDRSDICGQKEAGKTGQGLAKLSAFLGTGQISADRNWQEKQDRDSFAS